MIRWLKTAIFGGCLSEPLSNIRYGTNSNKANVSSAEDMIETPTYKVGTHKKNSNSFK